MSKKDLIGDLMKEVDASTIPSKYVIVSRVSFFDGSQRIVKSHELDEIREKNQDDIKDMEFVFNTKSMRMDILNTVIWVYNEINKRFADKSRANHE